MVKRKPSRAYSKNRPLKPKVTINDDDEDAEIRKEMLLKRLDDFDLQVRDVLMKMEADKQSTIDSIRHLYYADEQRTPIDINNMLWTEFLMQNVACPHSEIRESISNLVNKVEDQKMKTGTRKRPMRKVANTPADPPPIIILPPTRLRSQPPKTVVTEYNKENETDAPVAPSQSRRGKKYEMLNTPVNQGLLTIPSSLFITPKFDPRSTVPASSLRKPKFGEIAVSLKGSPLLVHPKDLRIDSLNEEDLDSKTREELKELHEKVSQLLNI